MPLNLPHLKFIKDNKIDIESAEVTPAFKRLINQFNKLHEKYNANTDPTFRNIAGADLEERSAKIMQDMETEFPDLGKKPAAKADAPKKPADKKVDQPKDDKTPADKKPVKKKADEPKPADKKQDDPKPDDKKPADKTADEPKDDKKPVEKKADDPKPADNKANPYDLSEKQLEAKKIIDKVWREKASNGELVISESELNELGFDCWSHLGMTTGKLGPYNFSSLFGPWTITKEDKKAD